MNDSLKRFHNKELNIRAYTALTRAVSNEICSIHKTTPNATYALSQGITAASLLSAGLKPESKQTLAYRIDGNGPLKSLYVQADSRGGIRGYAGNPGVDYSAAIGSISFSKAIGAGTLTVTKELGMKEPYSGVSALLYGSIARDTAYYLNSSEQIPSALIIACETEPEGTISAAGGILIQTFPDTEEAVITKIEQNINSLKQTLGDHLKEGKAIEAYLARILNNDNSQLLAETALEHRCSCSKDVIINSLKYVTENDIRQMIDEDKGAEVACTFCTAKYQISAKELQEILDSRQ